MIPLLKLKAHLGIAAATTTYDQILADYEKAAVAFLEREGRIDLTARGERVEYVTGTGLAHIWLAAAPASGTTVSAVERWLPDDAGTAIIAADVTVRGRRIFRADGAAWADGAEYEVTYTAGDNPGAEPADLRLWVIKLVELAWKERGKAGMQSETIGDYSYTRADATKTLPGLDRFLLNLGRRVRVG